MKMPLGTEVDVGQGHIVLDQDPAPPKVTQQPPLFSAHIYCGHRRLSQLLMSSCDIHELLLMLYFLTSLKNANKIYCALTGVRR